MALLWKDIKDDDDVCDKCPAKLEELCPCCASNINGGMPVDPPCCCFDDDDDIEEWAKNRHEDIRRYEEREDARIKAAKKRSETAKKAAETRRKMNAYCGAEIRALKQAKKELAACEKAEESARMLSNAINSVNEIFRYEERTEVNPAISETAKKLRQKVAEAETALETKKSEFRLARADK